MALHPQYVRSRPGRTKEAQESAIACAPESLDSFLIFCGGPCSPSTPLLHLQPSISLLWGWQSDEKPPSPGPWEGTARQRVSFLPFHLLLHPVTFPLYSLAPPPWAAGFSSVSLGFHSYELEITVASLLSPKHYTHSHPAEHTDQRVVPPGLCPLSGSSLGETALIWASASVSENTGCWVPGPGGHVGADCGGLGVQHQILAFVPHLGCALSQAQGPPSPSPGLPAPAGPTLRPTHTHTNARATCGVPPSSGSVLPPSAQTPQGSPSPSSGTTPQVILQTLRFSKRPHQAGCHHTHHILSFYLLCFPCYRCPTTLSACETTCARSLT